MTQHFDPSQKSAPNSDFDQGNVETNAVSPIDLLRDRFAGRWVISIFLALLVGTIAAVTSSLLAPVYYRGQGTLQGTSVHEIIIEEIAETESATRTFDLFLMGQVELLKGRQVIRHAAESEKLEDVIKIRGFEPMLNQMEDRLVAFVVKETQLIRVQYDDPDAEVSALTTNAIIESYIELHGMDSGDSLSEKEGKIRQIKKETRASIDSKRTQQQAIIRSSRYGTADLGPLIANNVEEMDNLRTNEKLIDLKIKKLKDNAREQGREITGKEIPMPTDAELNTFEPSLVALRKSLEDAVIQLDQMRAKLTPEHRNYRTQQSRIDSLKSNLKTRVVDATEQWKIGPGQEQSYEQLIERKVRISDMASQAREEIAEMNELRDRFDSLQREIVLLNEEYSKQDGRQRELQHEQSAIGDSVRVVEWATAPLKPDTDKTFQIAAAAFAAGSLGIFGIFFLLGSIDQRAYAIRQLQTDKGVFQCLGVIPNTGPTASDPEAVDAGLTCVHRLRNRIESLRPHNDEGFVILISSPFQGDGKTTVVTLLGWSYADAGYKTCIVDGDFIGRSLSHQFEKLDKPGMKEAIKKGKIGRTILNIEDSNLNILPIGIDETVHPEHMQLNAINPILTELRQQFDIILVDTGPLSGSIESIPIAGAVDGVILTLRKGRSRLPLRRCVKELRDLNAPYLGVVLNYAEKADYRNFSSKSKSIDDLLKEEAAGIREKNPLTERIATGPNKHKSKTESSKP